MAKIHKLSSSWNVNGGVLQFEISAVKSEGGDFVGKFSRSINLAEVFGSGYASLNEAGTGALEFGAFTAIRNSTGSCETLEEAEAAVDRRLDAFTSGEWGAEREQNAVPFSDKHPLCIAVERASKGAQSAAEAAAKLNEKAEATCAANGLALFASLEPADRNKIRKAVIEAVKSSRPAIAAALTLVEAERAAEALRRKQEKATKAAAEAEGNDAGAML